ncbi:putative Ig domain-containing protein [Phenylobacterium sp.]|uniref:putative Ig domain-containing protein n=1 Tax=Phenylobacterium sp. TaxID=1871053 RepID=UPI0025CEB609|nr:putative Ig domain-containing protein [Phenylobacterium sp.]
MEGWNLSKRIAAFVATCVMAWAGSAAAAISVNDNNTHVDRGVPYSHEPFLTASGGSAPYAFTVSGGVPTGLVVNSDGTVSGTTCGSNGSFSLSGSVRDATNATASISPSLIVNRAPAGGCSLTFSLGALPSATLGQSYSTTITASGINGTASYSLNSGSLPTGLSLSSSGVLSGTPTGAGSYTFTILAQDTAGDTGVSPAYTITVSAASISITTASLNALQVGAAFSQTLSATGGTAPYSFAVTSGSLPGGLSLAGGGGLSGTPTTAGAYSFTVTVTDANSSTANRAYSGSVAAALSISTTSVATPVVGVAYSQAISATGGTAPVTFAVSAGALPAGLALNGTSGAITGTPTTSGAFSFSITATDAGSRTATRAYSGSVAAAVSITTASLSAPTVGAAYSQTLGATGGTSPYSFSVTSGSLPAGLSLASGGAITGTPTTAGAYSFTVTVTDAASATASQAYSGTVAAAPVSLAITGSLSAPTVGAAYSQTLGATGGTSPYSFSVTSGSLPAGLSLASGGAITGTPTTAGAYSFTVTVTDAASATASQAYSGTVAAAPVSLAITTGSLPGGTVGAAYSQALGASGGTSPYSFGVTSGALPPGLALGGGVAGTPTTAGTYNFTITVTDAASATALQAYSVTIAASPPPPPPPPPPVVAQPATVETAYQTATQTITLASSGEDATFTVTTPPAHGTVTLKDGEVTYVPEPGYVGQDQFSYTATVGSVTSDPAVVRITVAPPPPPQADSPPVQTIDAGNAASGTDPTATRTVGAVAVDLAALVRGVATDVQLRTMPSHGTVTLRRPGRASALAEGGSGGVARRPAAALDGFTATYVPETGYRGPDAFTFVAIGPGGESAPARVSIQVVAPAPTAAPISVSGLAGRVVTVDVTAAAQNGPFTAARLLDTPPASVGVAQLVAGGTPAARTYQLTFAPAATFTGSATVTYALTGEGGESAPLTVTFTVQARPDPGRDPLVRGLESAETEMTRQFARAQIDNVRDRLDQLHARRSAGSSVRFVSGVADRQQPDARAGDPPPPEAPGAAGLTLRGGGERAIGQVEPWIGGSVTVGRRKAGDGAAKLALATSGVSAGLDARVSETLTVGLAAGAGRGSTDVDGDSARVEDRAWSLGAYGSFTPVDGVFVDAAAGGGRLSFDLRRSTPSGPVTGSRDADILFGSLAAGLERRQGVADWSAYGRLEGVRAALHGYVEQGSDDVRLSYDGRHVGELAAVLGARIAWPRRYDFGVVTPRARIEWRQELLSVGDQVVRYADWLNGPAYSVDTDTWARGRFSVGVGAQVAFGSGWTVNLDATGEAGAGQTSATARLTAGRTF